MPVLSAYLLISHGSRDPRPQVAMAKLAEWVRVGLRDRCQLNLLSQSNLPSSSQAEGFSLDSPNRLPLSYPLVETATLELGDLPLHQQIQQFAEQTLSLGYHSLQLLPLFLLPGVHVREDIPQEVRRAQQALGARIKLDERPYLGSHPRLPQLLLNQTEPLRADGTILLCHGTQRGEGNQGVECVAQQVGAVVAYWSMKPSLDTQIQTLVKKGCHSILIVPYFLFYGGITDAIAQQVTTLTQQFPTLHLTLAQPLGTRPELADLVIDLMDY